MIFRRLILTALFVFLSVSAARAFTVMPRNLEQLASRAGVIFSGTCVDIEETYMPDGVPVVKVTYEVDQSFKGDVGATYTFYQYEPTHGGKSPSSSLMVLDDSLKNVMPAYQVGERNILFLYPVSGWGLTSPIAMGQGKFTAYDYGNGKTIVVNRFGNFGLFKGSRNKSVKAMKLIGVDRDSGLVDYDMFISVIKELAGK